VQSHCRFAIGRIFNVVGPYETNPHLIPEILKRLKTSRRIEIGNVESERDYVHVEDVSRAIVRMIQGIDSSLDICNIGTGQSWNALQVLQVLSTILGENIECAPSARYKRRVDRPMLAADIRKIKRDYGWEPEHSFERALRDALQYAWSEAAME